MTHEQKPENMGVRNREELEALASGYISRHHLPDCWDDVCDMIDEMMSAGAAEQRRKDAEGAGPVGWSIKPEMVEGKAFSVWPRARAQVPEWNIPLYTQPVNVAALIAKAVTAERERCLSACASVFLTEPLEFPADTVHQTAVEHCIATIVKGTINV